MKGKIPIKAAQSISDAHDQAMVVIFGVAQQGNRFCLTTYGKTKKLCKLAGSFADQIADLIHAGAIVPPATEPDAHGEPREEEHARLNRARALWHNLQLAVHHLDTGIPPTPDALANMREALRRAGEPK